MRVRPSRHAPLIRRVILGENPWNRDPLPEPARILPSIRSLLAEPTWSVRSLLPPRTDASFDKDTSENSSVGGTNSVPYQKHEITKEKLHHLLRLSALPLPASLEEEQKLLDSLHRHLHFVRAVQNVDTRKPSTWETPHPNPNNEVASTVWSPDPSANNGEVEPLITIRDESYEGIHEATIHLRDLWPTLLKEERKSYNKTVRRRWKVNTNWTGGEFGDALDQMLSASDSTQKDQDDAPSKELTSEVVAEITGLREAYAEQRDWWIDVDGLGGGLESRKKGKYFFVQRGKKKAGEVKETQVQQSEVQDSTTADTTATG